MIKNIKIVTVFTCLLLLFVSAGPATATINNLVANSGFENGMIGYSTTYSPYPGSYNSSGQAGVTTNPRLLQGNFLSFTGDGNFLVANSSTNGNNEFICQDVSVEQNKTYTFSVTSRSVFSSTASHAWYVNGTAITGTINAPLGAWLTSTGTWNSGSATTARLCGKNMSRVYTGADFAIDNLVLQANAPACTPHLSQKCVGNAVFWFNSCNAQEELAQTCQYGCSNNACQNQTCVSHSNKQCAGNVAYWYNSCNAREDVFQQCTASQTCAGGACTNLNIACNSNTDCGTNAYEGSAFCQGNGVYKNFRTYVCANAGTSASSCSSSVSPQLQNACLTNQTCSGGLCLAQNINCSSNTDCGTNAYTGSPYCQNSNVYQNYLTWTCANPGTSASFCSQNTVPQLKTTCSGNQACTNGSCTNQNNNCDYHSYQQCSGNNLYWYDSCGNRQDGQYCQNGCSGNSCSNNNNNCAQNSYQRCSGNYLYWYDSCGNQQGTSQYCQNGCYNNSCQNYNNYNNYSNCTYHAYKNCLGNSVYWYDSCGTQQDLFQSCYGTNMVCKYGQCVYQQPYIPPVIPPVNPYTAHYKTACYSNNLYWYDSFGKVNTLYKNCADTNNCTQDGCVSGKCDNTLKCDGTTCATGSADYSNYCASSSESALPTISFFARQNQNPLQWQKAVSADSNSTVYFMISIVNSSGIQANNINVFANIPGEIASLGNLQIDGYAFSGDIVSGINIGSLDPGTAKSITFEGKTQVISASATKQAVATVSGQTDSVSMSFNPGQVAGVSVSTAETTSGFWEFIKRWYLWILVGLVLVFLFVVVFRRLSSNA